MNNACVPSHDIRHAQHKVMTTLWRLCSYLAPSPILKNHCYSYSFDLAKALYSTVLSEYNISNIIRATHRRMLLCPISQQSCIDIEKPIQTVLLTLTQAMEAISPGNIQNFLSEFLIKETHEFSTNVCLYGY